jgi:predicted RNase H-like nuclease (RuvC/YqgF family)
VSKREKKVDELKDEVSKLEVIVDHFKDEISRLKEKGEVD